MNIASDPIEITTQSNVSLHFIADSHSMISPRTIDLILDNVFDGCAQHTCDSCFREFDDNAPCNEDANNLLQLCVSCSRLLETDFSNGHIGTHSRYMTPAINLNHPSSHNDAIETPEKIRSPSAEHYGYVPKTPCPSMEAAESSITLSEPLTKPIAKSKKEKENELLRVSKHKLLPPELKKLQTKFCVRGLGEIQDRKSAVYTEKENTQTVIRDWEDCEKEGHGPCHFPLEL